MATTLGRSSDARPAHHQPGPRRHRGPAPNAIRELLLIAVAALCYSLVRGLTDDRVGIAFANAEQIIAAERALGIFVEPDLQQWAMRHDLFIDLANGVYIAYWPILVGTLLWLLIRHPDRYAWFRNALLASGALTLVVFALYPLAPPRFLPEHGFTDTIAAHSTGYRDFNASAFVNEYAAMPSLHFGWVLLAGLVIIRTSGHRSVRLAAGTLPVLMLAAIVVTGNHYLLDAFVGAAVVIAGLGIATWLPATSAAVRLRRRFDRDQARRRRP